MGRAIEVDQFPDSCPHCHYAGKQIFMESERVVTTRRYPRLKVVYLATRCPREECGKPAFAIYEEPADHMRHLSGDTYRLRSQTPWTPARHRRDAAVAAISTDFYEILDQAAAAEAYGLPLIAGAGYRKALEYLVKDYVLAEPRKNLETAIAAGNTSGAASIQAEIDKLLERPLGGKNGIIALIEDERLQKVAERAVWLGNDEVHYTKKWDDKDIEDLKLVLDLVVSIIQNNARYTALLEDMP